MSGQYTYEPMLEMFIFETSQLIEQLETTILSSEKVSSYCDDTINEVFRIMHTIKGSSTMMLFNNISSLAHSIEDLFFYLREEKPSDIDCSSLSDLILEGVDFIKVEIQKLKSGDEVDGDPKALVENINNFLRSLKKGKSHSVPKEEGSSQKQQYYIPTNKKAIGPTTNNFKATVYFEDGCEMENIRAYTIVHNLKDITEEFSYYPQDIIENDSSVQIIREQGFIIYIKTDKSYEEVYSYLMKTIFLKYLELVEIEEEEELQLSLTSQTSEDIFLDGVTVKSPVDCDVHKEPEQAIKASSSNQSIISVSVQKLDKLMDLVGEMVIAEAMVIENPDLKGLDIENFHKAARQLHKITTEIQDMVMSIRMVPLATTFHKMHRVVRDMSRKLEKEVRLEIIGEETEVDKNIIEYISDPLMHLVRNALDHGLEKPQERTEKGKNPVGVLTLEAKNAGSEVVVAIKDDGRGLNKEKLLKKARENNLLFKAEDEMSDKEIYSLIFHPGFSTKEQITEFSGRGVGMDVVASNIQTIGGTVLVDSIEDKGTTITIKIPLTLAIIDGMNIRVGRSRYTLPTTSIKESFRPRERDIIKDPEGNEMIMVRGQCYPILRLHTLYNVKTNVTYFTEGILIMVEQEERKFCVFADELLGQQQVVVKALPNYIKNTKKIGGLAGCTLLGDGNISLILDIEGLCSL